MMSDEAQTLVIDNGPRMFAAGFTGDKVPHPRLSVH
jgi:hypothetical protein